MLKSTAFLAASLVAASFFAAPSVAATVTQACTSLEQAQNASSPGLTGECVGFFDDTGSTLAPLNMPTLEQVNEAEPFSDRPYREATVFGIDVSLTNVIGLPIDPSDPPSSFNFALSDIPPFVRTIMFLLIPEVSSLNAIGLKVDLAGSPTSVNGSILNPFVSNGAKPASDIASVQVLATPIPAPIALLGSGIAVLGFLSRRRRRAA